MVQERLNVPINPKQIKEHLIRVMGKIAAQGMFDDVERYPEWQLVTLPVTAFSGDAWIGEDVPLDNPQSIKYARMKQATMPPVVAIPTSAHKYGIIDGMHRVTACRINGWKVKAYIPTAKKAINPYDTSSSYVPRLIRQAATALVVPLAVLDLVGETVLDWLDKQGWRDDVGAPIKMSHPSRGLNIYSLELECMPNSAALHFFSHSNSTGDRRYHDLEQLLAPYSFAFTLEGDKLRLFQER